MPRALIVGDQPLFSDALAMTLRGFVGLGAVEAVERPETTLNRLAVPPRPDVIVADGLVRFRAMAQPVPVIGCTKRARSRPKAMPGAKWWRLACRTGGSTPG